MPTGVILPTNSGTMFDGTGFDGAGSGRKRLVSGLLAAGLQVALAMVLLYGLAGPAVRANLQSALTSLVLHLPPPPPSPLPRHAARRAGAAAASGRRAQAAPFVAPRVVPLDPPVIPVASVAGQGAQPSAGAATAGNGSGAAGQGNGTGAGGNGEGDGGGAGAELISGRIKPSDTPGHLFDAPFSGTTSALVLIDATGTISACRTQRSSGNATLDALTCHLITTRFRFKPASDAMGRPIAGRIIYEHDWEIGGGFDNDPPSQARPS